MISFGLAVQVFRGVKNERLIDQGIAFRVAQHGDEKAWKSWVAQLRSEEDEAQDDSKAFMAAVSSGLR